MAFLIPRKSVFPTPVSIQPQRLNESAVSTKSVNPATATTELASSVEAEDQVSKSDISNQSSRPITTANSRKESVVNFYPACCVCPNPLKRKPSEITKDERCGVRFLNQFLCPPAGVLSRCVYFILANALIWVLWWGLDPDIAIDTVSAMVALEVVGIFTSVLFILVDLPPLLAPLILGIVINNIPGCSVFFDGIRARKIAPEIRSIALATVLTRAGVGMDPRKLWKLKAAIPLVSFLPCTAEACTCAALFYAYFQHEGVKLSMGFVAGFALAAGSAAVVVAGVLPLQKRRYGIQNGITTLLMGAASLDAVFVVAAYSIAVNFAAGEANKSGTTNEEWKLYAGAVGILVGVLTGVIIGGLLTFIPSVNMGSRNKITFLRVFMLLILNHCCLFVYGKVNELKWLSGAGPIGVLVSSFTAMLKWRKEREMDELKDPPNSRDPRYVTVENSLAMIWTIIVPWLFGFIGMEIYISKFDWVAVGKLISIVFISLMARCLMMFIIVSMPFLIKAPFKERVFCAFSWIPKAVLQATLAPALEQKFGANYPGVNYIILLALLGILICAPLGSIWISVSGKRLLRQAPDENEELKAVQERQSLQDKPNEIKSAPDQQNLTTDDNPSSAKVP